MTSPQPIRQEIDPVESARAALFELCDFPLDAHDERARNAIAAAIDQLAQLRASESRDAARLLAQEVRRLADCNTRVAQLEAQVQQLWDALTTYAYHAIDCPRPSEPTRACTCGLSAVLARAP